MSYIENHSDLTIAKFTTYARYRFAKTSTLLIGKRLGSQWHRVIDEKFNIYPSGCHLTLYLECGETIKAHHCDIIQVFEK